MELEQLCGQLIVAAGEAKSYYIESMMASRQGKFSHAMELLQLGRESYHKGHELHAMLLQISTEDTFEPNLLLMHAEDQMMNCEAMEIISGEILIMYERMNQIEIKG